LFSLLKDFCEKAAGKDKLDAFMTKESTMIKLKLMKLLFVWQTIANSIKSALVKYQAVKKKDLIEEEAAETIHKAKRLLLKCQCCKKTWQLFHLWFL
jgi:biopolymer transport protein ExbB